MKDIFLGKFLGYSMVLKGVPDHRMDDVKKMAIKHLERMQKAFDFVTFGGERLDLENIKNLTNTMKGIKKRGFELYRAFSPFPLTPHHQIQKHNQ